MTFSDLANMYVSLAPVIFMGIFNMIWCRLPVCKALAVPIDGGFHLRDGRMLLGVNKTWKGFIGYVILGLIFTPVWGVVCGSGGVLFSLNFLYVSHANTFLYNLLMGLLLGLAYALFELPNSFIKRRIGIEEGKNITGFKRPVFVFFDQADSIIGCVLVICFVYPMSVLFFLCYVLVGAATHIVINILLYLAHLRRNMF
ncbi:MAG: CDP-archaeol synthase [Clostridiales Family XIII bacterium]|jgi:CDP-diglyceride synthetase|nr:CDP-archaeol synthase [Clostridiales Family XIII bacterium]